MKTIRKANAKWREGAPDFIVDVFDHPKYHDRFTVVTNHRYEHGNTTYVAVLGSSENMGFSGWTDMPSDIVARMRYKWGHNRIRYSELPEKIRHYLESEGGE